MRQKELVSDPRRDNRVRKIEREGHAGNDVSVRPVYKTFECPCHGRSKPRPNCATCAEAVDSYRRAMQSWRAAESAALRERIRQQPRSSRRRQPPEPSAAERAMDE